MSELEIQDLTVSFGGVVAVDDVSLQLAGGTVVGLVGPNGSGKTTLFNALTGVVGATGTVRLDGEPLKLGRPLRIRRQGVLRTFQSPQVQVSLTCLENVLLALDYRDHTGLAGAWLNRRRMWRSEEHRWAAGREALERVGLAHLSDTPSSLLTYGQRRLLDLAGCLAADFRVLLLDEPTAGLNDAETTRLAGLVQQAGSSGALVVVVEHRTHVVEAVCERVLVLSRGRLILDGEPSVVWKDPQLIDAYLGRDIAVE